MNSQLDFAKLSLAQSLQEDVAAKVKELSARVFGLVGGNGRVNGGEVGEGDGGGGGRAVRTSRGTRTAGGFGWRGDLGGMQET
jgi:hypothetical protein